MDGEGIKELRSLVAVADVNNRLEAVGIDAVATPYKIDDLSRFREFRRRLIALVSTRHINSFAKYVSNSHKTADEISVFVNQDQFSARCVLDLGNNVSPGHCDHVAILSLEKSPEFVALETFLREGKTQRHFAEFLEDYAPMTSAFADGKPMETKQSIVAVRNFKLDAKSTGTSAVTNLSESKSLIESVQATSMAGVLPDSFVFRVAPYLGLQERDFHVRVAIRTEPPVQFSFKSVRKEETLLEAAEEFTGILSGLMSGKKIYLGTINTSID